MRHAETKIWEPVSTRVKRGESPSKAAARSVKEHLGLDIYFPNIHQLQGAPPGLLLYSEYPISPSEFRQSLIFLGEVDTKNVTLGKAYEEIMWTPTDKDLPREILPEVRAAFPYAVMAAGLIRPIGGL